MRWRLGNPSVLVLVQYTGHRWASKVSRLLAGQDGCTRHASAQSVSSSRWHEKASSTRSRIGQSTGRKAGKGIVTIRGGVRPDAWRQADWRCRRYSGGGGGRGGARDPRCWHALVAGRGSVIDPIIAGRAVPIEANTFGTAITRPGGDRGLVLTFARCDSASGKDGLARENRSGTVGREGGERERGGVGGGREGEGGRGGGGGGRRLNLLVPE